MIDHKDQCKECRKMVEVEELSEFDGLCWECYREKCDEEFPKNKEEKDANASDFWGLL